MSKYISIRTKVSSLTNKISLFSIVAVSVIALTGLLVLRANMVKVSSELGDRAAGDSQTALEQRMTDRLMVLASNRAALSDAALRQVRNSVNMISRAAGEMLQNQSNYNPNPAMPPDTSKSGVMSAQFLTAENIQFSDIAEESAIMGNIQNILLNVIENNVKATTDYIGSEKGYSVIVDESPEKKAEFFDTRERPWYKLAKENGKLSWTDVYNDAYGRGLAITCAEPYYDTDGNIAGVAGVGMVLTDVTDIVIGTKVGETGYAFMVNELGQIIISENLLEDENGNIIRESLLDSENAMLKKVAGDMVQRKNGIERGMIDREEYIIAYATLDILPWSLATVMEVAEAIAPALESREHIIAMKNDALSAIDIVILAVIGIFIAAFVLLLFFVGFASKRFAYTLTKPITVLKEGVRKIADGNLNYSIDLHTGDEIEDLSLSINKMALALREYIFNIQMITADKERIGAELNVATSIQASMLPCIFPAFPDRPEIDIYASMQPAKEVGGDFYDFFLVDERTLAIVIADVSGKGVPAALFMVIAKTLIKNNAQYGKSPKETFEIVNNLLCENNEAGMFVTAFMGYLDIPSGRLSFVNAGHNPPLLRSGGRFDWLPTKPGFVLAGMEDMFYKQGEVTLNVNDELFLYTDGVTEAVNNEKELFTDPRLLEVTNKYIGLPLKEFTVSIKREIDNFAEGAEQADDITMLALRYKGQEGTEK